MAGGKRKRSNTNSSNGGTTKKAKASAPTSETKYFDVGIAGTVTWTGTTWANSEVPATHYVNSSGAAAAYTDSALIPTANGSGYGQVIGNKYKLKRLRVRGYLSTGVASDQADVLLPRTVRALLVHDTQPNGAQAQGEDILQAISAAPQTINAFMRVADNIGRFRVIADKTFVLNNIVAGTDGASTNSCAFNGTKFKFDYKPKNPIVCTIKSGNATPTVAGLVNNNLFMLVAGVAGGASGAAIGVNVVAASRAYYCE